MTDSVRWWLWLVPAVLVAVLGLGAHPVLSPDAIELALAGRCWVAGAVSPELCEGTEPWFWPPGFPALVGLPALFLDPALAALLGGLLAYGLLGGVLARLGLILGGGPAAVLAPLMLLAVPTLRAHALMGDARALALAGILAAILVCHEVPSRRGAVAAGVLLGAAVLTREESLGAAVLVGGVALVRSRTSWPLLPAALGVAAPWTLFLSLRAGHFVPTSRAWQGAAARWVEAFPRQWVFADLSAGSRGSPLRTLLSQAAASGTGEPPSVSAAVAWVGTALPATLPWPVAVLAAGGAAVLWARAHRPALALLAGGVVPALAVAALPAARDPILPANNLLVVHVVACLLASVALASGVARLPRKLRGPVTGSLGLVLLLVASNTGAFPLFQRDAHPPPRAVAAAADWLAGQPPGRGAGSLVGSAPLHRAGWTRTRLPPPTAAAVAWSVDTPDLVVVSSLDQPDHSLTPRLLQQAGARPVAQVSHEGDAFTLWAFPPRSEP